MQIGRIIKLICGLCCILCAAAPFSLAGGFMGVGKHGLVVGKNLDVAKFREFYYTYASTTFPPEFQRYRFYLENGRPVFYHEKREGKKVFLTKDDVTISGTMPLAPSDWEKFLSLVRGGTVSDRVELDTTGSPGPWLYLYWDGDKGKKQLFEFARPDIVLEFEKFCAGLKATEIEKHGHQKEAERVSSRLQ